MSKNLFEMIDETKQYGDSIKITITVECVRSVRDLTAAICDVERELHDGAISGVIDDTITFNVEVED